MCTDFPRCRALFFHAENFRPALLSVRHRFKSCTAKQPAVLRRFSIHFYGFRGGKTESGAWGVFAPEPSVSHGERFVVEVRHARSAKEGLASNKRIDTPETDGRITRNFIALLWPLFARERDILCGPGAPKSSDRSRSRDYDCFCHWPCRCSMRGL